MHERADLAFYYVLFCKAQALAMADAAQERLELESKLMDLQAKKEQMDTLVEQLHQLRAMQLGKGINLSKNTLL